MGSLLTICKPIALETRKWHTYPIKANGSMISVSVDDQKLYNLDLSKGTKPSFNLGGTMNNYAIALKDLPKKDRIRIQDCLGSIEFRNFPVKEC